MTKAEYMREKAVKKNRVTVAIQLVVAAIALIALLARWEEAYLRGWLVLVIAQALYIAYLHITSHRDFWDMAKLANEGWETAFLAQGLNMDDEIERASEPTTDHAEYTT